ncbi:MAG: aspartate-semialdehyde dehydrogenase, partial [Acidobacteriota bacterium]
LQPYTCGGLVANPNCSTIGLVLALKPLHDAFDLDAVQAVTLQAVSGAGWPGVSALELVDNVIPFIEGEEEKIEQETRKILGNLSSGQLSLPEFPLSAQCNRVPVLDGHLICVSVRFQNKANEQDIRSAWASFQGEPQDLQLPSAPAHPIHWRPEADAPQPRLHRDAEKGMSVSVGRLRPCPVLGHRFSVLSHNTVRGAAGGAVLAAELAVARGHLRGPLARHGEA